MSQLMHVHGQQFTRPTPPARPSRRLQQAVGVLLLAAGCATLLVPRPTVDAGLARLRAWVCGPAAAATVADPAGLPAELRWVVDARGNKCNIARFGSREAARAALASLEDCENCVDCVNCHGCRGCDYCNGCVDCADCKDCVDCADCGRCAICLRSRYCRGCDMCFDCDTCEKCRECDRCRECRGEVRKRDCDRR